MANWVLFQWGPIQFQVHPLNVGEYSHATAADWAKKEIAGAAMYREWVGESDETIQLKGRVFPHYFARKSRQRNPEADKPSSGGLGHLDVLDNMRRMGQAHVLIRGDGWHFGWFVIESLQRAHSLIAPDGIGQQIDFEASFQRVPVPDDPGTQSGYLTGTTGPATGTVEPTPTPSSNDSFA
jgi:phage protein U